jgi:hypothetical protein
MIIIIVTAVETSNLTISRTLWTGDQPYLKAATYPRRHKQQKREQISVPQVGLEPTIPVFEQAKMFHASDRAAIAIGQVE